ncbi:hypothetical protein BO82DRAFT_404209 [Aspergillus uvarum CBS 121591]|uniref:Uncharacterized protein n=1 Tax=Aspergillus uvarum CBS 121591 TaxID=1448315 RepID=A0A319DJF6_9EURO|nr:hypothetical protein BO82DRAFT_404209 [Aspergillus uvarum CBS 121591]PYH79572.1 hypothetical protein BO82DRAFT_404209 [Aspergillus uvarum CBS 121591]
MPGQESFQSVIDDSQDSATKTHKFARKFDNQDIPFCHDETKTIAERKTRIQGTISSLTTENSRITMRLAGVASDLTTFIDSFVAWAKSKEGELTAEVEKIKRDLIDLNGKVAQLELAARAFNHVGMGLLPIIEVLAAAFPPYGTAIAKERKQSGLEADLETMGEAREHLEGMRGADLNTFGGTISSMTITPEAAIQDATQILQ